MDTRLAQLASVLAAAMLVHGTAAAQGKGAKVTITSPKQGATVPPVVDTVQFTVK